ncbi:MAG: transposase [Nitrososphaerota archaeon]|jgi:transposase|nr:transposase [Nitrososphaerota archaeon]
MTPNSSPNFRRYVPNQNLLLPPSLNDWLPEDHLARFISEFVDRQIDLALFSGATTTPRREHGPFPGMLLKLLLYGYCIGTPTSRKVARTTYDDVAFRWIAADQHPSYSTLVRFRERNLGNFHALFLRMLKLSQ